MPRQLSHTTPLLSTLTPPLRKTSGVRPGGGSNTSALHVSGGFGPRSMRTSLLSRGPMPAHQTPPSFSLTLTE